MVGEILGVNEECLDKLGMKILVVIELYLKGKLMFYVLCGGFKFEKVFKSFEIDVIDKMVLDIGLLIGGFIDVVL